eukprot:CAMPEP_0113711560 /NCGR_PEP_ID=MMETSP0038_2-20120614/30835_1 /TAXON_ID=2898 /ORGANISM="Cryptomonas paramecium" /LENGTH=44 /DNA_ID=CAMNT_0000637851 /DNA_START=27 /DNA_END=158 /DNA_ORIENTATION=- /assembly_acc=CAM_ASM_000170
MGATFGQNWGKAGVVEAAVRAFTPWAVVECAPSYADRIFSAACS